MVGLLRGRRRVVMAAAATVALLAGVLTGVQIRAAEAAERREDVAAAEAAAAAAAAEAELRADQEEARVARVEVVLSWATAAQTARPALAAAEAALVASEAKVADDAVRQALAVIVADLHAALDDPPDTPTDDDVATLADLTAQVAPATVLVTEAQTTWQAEQDAAAAAAAQPRSSARGWPYDGAAPDCGSPESYEPSRGGTFHTSVPTEDGDGSNGNLPRSAMTPLPWCTDALGNQQWLRTDAAEALVRLNDAFRAQFGENIAIDLSYRSYADQVAIRAALGSIAAVPGTSNHGLGIAIDTWEWAAYTFGTPRYDWLVANAPSYGWVAPTWARQNGSNPEYWHYEYTG
jgi:LAS superfamily LD-carboxypeptidase LdcB